MKGVALRHGEYMIIKKKLAATTAAGLATLMTAQSVHAQEPTSTSKSLDEYEA